MKKVVAAILADVPTLNFDPTSPVVLEVHVGPKGLAAVYLQKDPQARRYLPVAGYSREVTTAELQKPVVALELMAAQEAARKLSQVSVSAPAIHWMVSPDLHALLKAKLHLGPELSWRVADVLSWGMTPVVRRQLRQSCPKGSSGMTRMCGASAVTKIQIQAS